MQVLQTLFYCALLLGISSLPVYFAGLNKKDKEHMGYVRIACWCFGWTGIGWIAGLYIAFTPNPKEP